MPAMSDTEAFSSGWKSVDRLRQVTSVGECPHTVLPLEPVSGKAPLSLY
jgi:hypothetical protein